MPITPINRPKNAITPSSVGKEMVTWDDPIVTWDSSIGMWDSFYKRLSNRIKNAVTFINRIKN